jgi:hypothetical protein
LTQNNFNRILLSAVEESLASSLGDSSKQAIFFHLESSFKLKKENIPSNLGEFARALEGIFGPGAPFLEKLITKRLHQKLGIQFEEAESRNFIQSIDSAKKHSAPKGELLTR